MRDDRGDERREIARQRRVDLYTILYTRWKNVDLDFFNKVELLFT